MKTLIMLLAISLVLFSCGVEHKEATATAKDGAAGPQGPKGATGNTGPMGPQGPSGIITMEGNSCSVTQTATGAKISCTDGTSAVINNGGSSQILKRAASTTECPDGGYVITIFNNNVSQDTILCNIVSVYKGADDGKNQDDSKDDNSKDDKSKDDDKDNKHDKGDK